MSYQSRINTAIQRTALVLLFWCLSGANGVAATRNVRVLWPAAIPQGSRLADSTIENLDQQVTTPVQLKQQMPSPSPTPAGSVAIATQSEQGRQYGQPGFIGEPINLNVVNADIRDILNYITEQYGVNFIIDSSVGAVPVTVNVQDVPWNIALDAILKANRLGIEVSGNILRVATTAVLATEAGTQRVINESRLDASPLVTEFIRLNYARAFGSLQSTAGAAGGFAGGKPAGATSSVNQPAAGGGLLGGSGGVGAGGDQGILPIIQRRLSKRGGIEVDQRSNTLIVTDVAVNIASIRQLVALLDQPEPQVEIETKIVIANRNFSRDLGVQLSAAVLNLGRGALGSASNLPGGPAGGTLPVSPNTQFGIPGGLNGGPVASAASTIIGLTTGIFGTAQISALITAGETKGQVKTIATPRVTVLNNRTGVISSGTSIPVQTVGQLGVVTTEFIEVPLQLSITPQITDAGTVVMLVTIENSNVSGVVINGIPAISTQKMSSEVLVPDGGTTVMGGVLQDSEGDAQQRTPGLASIPVLGNLFKRKQITRTTDEVLFFITPRIYRPDFKGRPTTGAVGPATRSTTISQPVPLGNPATNTPPVQAQPNEQPNLTPLLVAPAAPVRP
ncbi:MAG: type IV pilus secretin PilQ [Pyrinomonadaceae bacterium]